MRQSTSPPPSGGDQQIAGKRLVLNDSPAAANGSLFGLSHYPTITLGGGNESADYPRSSAAASASAPPL